MSNLPATQQQAQLPAHLAGLVSNTALMAVNAAAAAAITSGGFPRISIKGGMFRLITPAQEELVLQTRYADVIVLDANPFMSKVFYSKAYNPTQTDDVAPDCYSDNGVGPSQSAAKPQCGTCAACPHNVWGSKISENGNQTKACTDYKKLAVFMADNVDGPVFEFKIPPASLKPWLAYVNALGKAGIPVWSVVTRISFNPHELNVLMFEAAGLQQTGQLPYINQMQADAVQAVAGSDEVTVCIGTKDKPRDPNLALPAPAAVAAQNQQAATATLPPLQTPPPMPPMSNAAPAVITPQPAAAAPQAHTLPAASLPGAPLPPMAGTPPAAASTKRTRKPKADVQAPADTGLSHASLLHPPVHRDVQAPVPPFLQDMNPVPHQHATQHAQPNQVFAGPAQAPQNAANNTVPLNPPTTDASLDAMLRQAMAVK